MVFHLHNKLKKFDQVVTEKNASQTDGLTEGLTNGQTVDGTDFIGPFSKAGGPTKRAWNK